MLSVLCIFLSLLVLFALYVQTKRRLEMLAQAQYVSDHETDRLNRALNKCLCEAYGKSGKGLK